MYPRVIINVSVLPGMLGEVPGPIKNNRSGLVREGFPQLQDFDHRGLEEIWPVLHQID